MIVTAKFKIGQVVRHRYYSFRGVVFDVDPEFNNTEEWYDSIPKEIRPRKDQPFYHLLAENEETSYVAYVSEKNLLPDPKVDRWSTLLSLKGWAIQSNRWSIRDLILVFIESKNSSDRFRTSFNFEISVEV